MITDGGSEADGLALGGVEGVHATDRNAAITLGARCRGRSVEAARGLR